MKRSFWLALILALGLFVTARPVFAFSLSPSLTEVTIKPGETKQGVFTLINDEKTEQTYFVTIQKFLAHGDAGQQEYLPASDTSGLPNWIFLDRPSVTIPLGKTVRVPYSLRIPSNAAPGGNFATVFFGTRPPNAPESDIRLDSRIGSLFFVTVEGAYVRRLSVRDFSLLSDDSFSRLPVIFQTTVQNDGNIHEVPAGKIEIKNMFGQTVASLPVNSEGGRVLPNSTRRIRTVWQDAIPSDGSGFFHNLREEWRNFGFGSYSAKLVLSSPTVGGASDIVRFSVWPWHVIIAACVLFVGLLLLLGAYRRWVIYRATVS